MSEDKIVSGEYKNEPPNGEALEDGDGPELVFEEFNELAQAWLVHDVKSHGSSSFVFQAVEQLKSSLSTQDISRVRMVVTGNFGASVESRETTARRESYSRERFNGIVAGKTMPPNADGVIDVLMPIDMFVSDPEGNESDTDRRLRAEYVRHTVAHEAVHAQIFILSQEPFDVHLRRELQWATANFVSCASEQVEEHLAQYLSNREAPLSTESDLVDLQQSFSRWYEAVDVRLRAVSEADPDYFQIGMEISLTAALDLWKALAYLAAELRDEGDFRDVPESLRESLEWMNLVGRRWDGYLNLLSRFPMTVEQDIPTTDDAIMELATFLQEWFLELGFDFHDQEQGAYFRVTMWDS